MSNSIKTLLTASLFVGLGITELLKTTDISKSPQPVAIMPQHDNSFLNTQNIVSTRHLNDVPDKPYLVRDVNSMVNSRPLPVSLTKVGQYSKTIYNTAKANDWKNATKNLSLLECAVKDLNTEVKGEKILISRLNSKIAILKATVSAKNGLAAMHNANQVMLIAANMAVQFQQKVPVEVTLLHYYGHELEIWAPTGNRAWLHKTADNMRSTWYRIRPSVLVHSGTSQTQKFDTLIERVEMASSAQEYSHLATFLLDEMDKIEGVYKDQDKIDSVSKSP
ncbi:hypothetical protein NUACC21_67050 [Scytonema sp. NUACC21]